MIHKIPLEYNSDLTLEDDEFKYISKILYEETNIVLSYNKKELVYSRINRKVRALGFSSFRDYLRYVLSSEGQHERESMIDALTTNVTSFFRERHHFDWLSEIEIHEIKKSALSGNKVRIWSAACSSGEEVYSIALTLLECFPDILSYDVKILATDISVESILRGKDAVYSSDCLSKIPKNLHRFCVSLPDSKFTFSNDLKKIVNFRQLNLFDVWPFSIPSISIFCRNAAIYFDAQAQEKLWVALAGQLAPGGFLHIGHSEKIPNPKALALTQCDCPTTYRKDYE